MSTAPEVPAPEPQEDAVGSKGKRNSIGSSTEGASMRDSKRVRKPNALYTDGYQVETPKKGERPKEKATPEPTVPEPVVQTSGTSLILKRVKKPTAPETTAPAATSSPVTPSPAPAPSVQAAPAASPPAGADGEKKRRKDKMLTPEEVKQQRLPKGYALEVVGADSAQSKERLTVMLTGKRERRKSAVLEDFVDPSARRKGRKDKDSETEDEPDVHRKKAAKRELKLKSKREIQERLAAVEAKLSSYGAKPAASDSATSYAPGGAAPEATPLNGGVANGAATAMATVAPELNPEYIPPAAVAAHHAQIREQLHASLNASHSSLTASSSYVNVLASSSHSVKAEETVLSKRSHKPNSQFAEYETGDAPLAEEPLVALSKPSYKIQRPKKNRSADGGLSTSQVSPPPVVSAPVFPGRAQRTQRRRRQRSESPSESRSETAVLSPELNQCLALLKQLMKHQHAWPFNVPVDPVALNIPDYFDVIKHPMDLKTIRTNLENAQYNTIDQFNDDVLLVFTNCFMYNDKGTDIAVMAEAVKETYETQFKRLKSGDWNPSALEETMDEIKAARKEIRQLNRERKALTMSGGPAKPRGWQKEDNRPMSLDEKRALSAAINALPGEHLGSVVQIISERMPALTRGAQGEEIEVDIDALDPATLRHLERFVKNTQNKKKSSLARSADPALASSTSGAPTTVEDTGTSKRIKDVERRLQELNDKAAALTRIGGFNKKREPLIPEGVAQPIGGSNNGKSNDDDSSSSSSSSSSSDSDSSSSSDAAAETKSKTEPSTTAPSSNSAASALAPTILAPVAAAPKEVVLHNTDAWASLDAGATSAPSAAPSASEQSDGLWDTFKAKEKQNKQREREREEHEEKLRKEREEREEERKREEERRRKAAEEEEARRAKAATEAELAAQKQREEQRLAEKLAREAETPKVNLTEQSNVMSLFEAEPSSALKQEPTAPREG